MTSPFESAWMILKNDDEDEEMGATLPMPMPMADDVLEPIRQRQREEEESIQASLFNPFRVKPTPRQPPMKQERGRVMGGADGMSRGPMRSRKRGDPAGNPRFKRPGFRSTESMPLTDNSAESRMQ